MQVDIEYSVSRDNQLQFNAPATNHYDNKMQHD